MAGRPKLYQDEELIDRAINVFWQKGYGAASAQDLMKAMDIGQGSFYRSFPGGKKELYQKSLNRFIEKSMKQFYKGLAQNQDPIEFIKVFFYAVANRPTQESSNGCYIGNAIMESSNLDEDTKLLSVDLLKKLENGFEKAIKKAQTEGKLDANKSPKILALYLINLWNGINVTQRMNPQKKQILEVLKLNLQVLD